VAGKSSSGILSDTLVFRSPTTTDRDRNAAAWLASIAAVDVVSFGDELLRASPGLTARTPGDIIDTDRKSYQMSGTAVSIGQVEVTVLQELPDRRKDLLEALDVRRQQEGLALICLMVTDVVMGRSRLLCRGENWILQALPFTRITEGEFELDDMLSRKKQLVPVLMAVLDEPR